MAFKEIKSLTGIRGLAAIYVIVFHWYKEISIQTVGVNGFGNLILNFLNHGYLSVDLFFALSSFVLCLSSHKLFSKGVSMADYKSFMYKRFSRIFPLYLIITLLYYFVFHLGGIKNLIVNLLLLQGINPFFNDSIIPPGWSLTNEWVIYFIFPFLLYGVFKLNKKTWVLPLLSLFILLFVSTFRSHFLNWINYQELKNVNGFNPIIAFTRGPSGFLRTIASYFLGCYAYTLYLHDNKIRFVRYLPYILFILLFYHNSDVLIIILLPFFILFLTQGNLLSKFLSSKFVYFLGLISYSLYVNHYLFIKTYKQLSAFVGVNNNALSFFYVLTGTFVFSIITYYMVEKPGMTFFKKNHATINNAVNGLFIKITNR